MLIFNLNRSGIPIAPLAKNKNFYELSKSEKRIIKMRQRALKSVF